MDKLVDHLFVMEGDGKISDFWGSYTDWHNQSKSLKQKPQSTNNENSESESDITQSSNSNQYTMNEYMKQITKLTNQKDKLLLQIDEV
jgi:ATP-binding cassette subfamily F protein uup